LEFTLFHLIPDPPKFLTTLNIKYSFKNIQDNCGEWIMRSLWGHWHSCTQCSVGWVWHSPGYGKQIKAYENWTQARWDAVNCFYL
jgi:hypothetical protein